jgi:tRNA-dihydrouridine synthase 3
VSSANALCGTTTNDDADDASRAFDLIGNGDVFGYRDYDAHVSANGGAGVATCMIARGALIKPWIFTEIKESRDWDISSGERLDLLRQFAAYGLEHWGADARGVANTRRFLLEWLSFLHRYVPVGLLERAHVGIHERPPSYVGRNDLETLMASTQAADWVKITSMLLGPPPEDFHFKPKHKSNAYAAGSEGAAAHADWGPETQG